MPAYKVFDTHIHHDGKPYGPGDTIELTEEQAARLHVEPVTDEQKQKKEKGKK